MPLQDYNETGPFKTVLLVPIHFPNSTVLAVPEPEKQSADLYLLEIPIAQVIEMDASGVHLLPPMYLSDPYST